jgi:hypothetical protein
LLSACQFQISSTQPPAQPATQPAATQQSGASTDIALDYSGLAQNVTLETVAAQPATSDGPWWAGAPQYRLLTLQGYPVINHQSKPQVFIYPAGELAAANENMGKVATELQSLLQTQQAGEPLPFLPLINAKQVIHPQVQNLDFKNGKGIRFLTMYSQGIVPINNYELIYTFQGLTSDGKYYIAAVLPVTDPQLPNDATVNEQLTGTGTDYQNYISKTVALLNQEPAGSFTPDLSKLDALIRSLEVK